MRAKMEKSLLAGCGLMIFGFGMWMQNFWAAVFMAGVCNLLADAMLRLIDFSIKSQESKQ